jgi:hypothetical protein
MQLLIENTVKTKGCSQVHKSENIWNVISKTYELANNRRSFIHKFISHRISSTFIVVAYKLKNKFALKKKRIINLLINGTKSRFARALEINSESLKVTFLFCAN